MTVKAATSCHSILISRQLSLRRYEHVRAYPNDKESGCPAARFPVWSPLGKGYQRLAKENRERMFLQTDLHRPDDLIGHQLPYSRTLY
jgi:hypothetical protein